MNPIRYLATILIAAAITAAQAPVSLAGIATRSGSSDTAVADDEDCGNAVPFYLSKPVIPSLIVTLCEDCRFNDEDRYALARSYGEAALRAGYILDPLNSSVLAITEIGELPGGKPYLKGVIGNIQITVGEPIPGETLATVAGKMALVVVAREQ